MQAVLFHRCGAQPVIAEVAEPAPPPGGVLLRVGATRPCRGDWHGWRGHDSGIALPHVPGHELGVRGWAVGERVTVPFVGACGRCARCRAGDQQQPGFTPGSFAQFIAVPWPR